MRLKNLRVKPLANRLPFHVRAAAALGMWLALAEVGPKKPEAPKALVTLTLQLLDDAVQIPADRLRACRICGCTDDRACEGGCWWVAADLCSSCAPGVSKAVAFKHVEAAARLKARREAKDEEALRIRARNAAWAEAERKKRSHPGRSKR